MTHLYRGKVRDLYDVDDHHMLMVASDRLSAFDVVMAEEFPGKGRVLTALTDYWLTGLGADVPNARVSCNPAVIERYVPGFLTESQWHGRAMLVRRAEMLPLEFIIRARMAGTAWAEYQSSGTVNTVSMPTGMQLTDAFPAPILTPATKVDGGHDINISLQSAADAIGQDVLDHAAEICMGLFNRATEKMTAAGLVLADTKFELGLVDGELVVCDELLTPDSSRIWPADSIVRGESPPSYDKQPFRDWLATLDWDRTPPPPPVPAEIVEITTRRYVAAYENVTGLKLSDWYGQP